MQKNLYLIWPSAAKLPLPQLLDLTARGCDQIGRIFAL